MENTDPDSAEIMGECKIDSSTGWATDISDQIENWILWSM